MLWEIIGTPHRLLGSCHSLPENFEFPDWVTNSRAGIKRFVFERDHRNLSDDGMGIDQTEAHLKLPGVSEVYQRAKSFLVSIGCNDAIEPLLPWKAASYLDGCISRQLGLNLEDGLEYRFRALADIMKLSVEFLESPKRTLELIDLACEPDKGGIAYFEDVLRDAESGAFQLQLQNQIDAWINNSFEACIISQMDSLKSVPYIFNALITQRNREWVTPANRLLSETMPTLFIVGALHVVGSGSFIEQLEASGFRFKLGYKVKPV